MSLSEMDLWRSMLIGEGIFFETSTFLHFGEREMIIDSSNAESFMEAGQRRAGAGISDANNAKASLVAPMEKIK